jgi:hypothetical protein
MLLAYVKLMEIILIPLRNEEKKERILQENE